MRCFVTGATGFVGSHASRRLLSEGCAVAALVRPSANRWRIADIERSLALIPGDLDALTASESAIAAFRPDVIVHCGWRGRGRGFRDDAGQFDWNVGPTLDLVRIARRVGCRRFVAVGSQAEYGPINGSVNEETYLKPTTAYGVAKYCLGLVTAKMCSLAGIEHCWLRLFAAYGPFDDRDTLIPSLVFDAANGRSPRLGPGTNRLDYLHTDDVAAAIARACSIGAGQGSFVLGSGRAETVRWTAERVWARAGAPTPLSFGAIDGPPGQSDAVIADSRRLRDATGWRPTIELENGLDRTVDWLLANQARYPAI